MNTFVINILIPDGMMALTRKSVTIWYGPLAEVPQGLFEQADQSHVSEKTYNDIAAKAEKTGKGHRLQ